MIRFDHVDSTISFASSVQAFAADLADADLVVPMEIPAGDSMPLLEVSIGERSFVASLDTGSSLGLEVFAPYAEELGLGHAFREWEANPILGGSIGRATAYDGVVEEVEIGTLRLMEVATSITPARGGDSSGRKGNLGNQLWVGYVLILDYPGQRLIFRKK